MWEVYFASRFHRHIPAHTGTSSDMFRPRPQLPSCCEAHQGSGCQQSRRAWHAKTKSNHRVKVFEKLIYRHARLCVLYTYIYILCIYYISIYINICIWYLNDSMIWFYHEFYHHQPWYIKNNSDIFMTYVAYSYPKKLWYCSDTTVTLSPHHDPAGGLQGWKMASVVPAASGRTGRIQQEIPKGSRDIWNL